MENQDVKIDEIFRQQLQNAELPPPPFVWPAVENELRKRRRIVAAWWLFAFGMFAVASVGLWKAGLWSTAAPSNTILTSAIELQKKVQEVPVQEQTETASGISASAVVENAPTHSLSTSTEAGASSVKFKQNAVAESQQSFSTKVGIQKVRLQTDTEAKQKVSIAKIQNPTIQQSSSLDNTAVSPTPEGIDLAGFKPLESLLAPDYIQINAPRQIASIAHPNKTAFPKSLKSLSRRKKDQPRVCYDFARHPSAMLIDVYAGPSMAQRQLTSRLDDQPYLNQRLSTERRNAAFNAGLRASLMFNSNFLVRTGLNFDQITEIFEYIDPAYTQYTIKIKVLPNGMTDIDTIGVEYGENYLKTYNRYSTLDVPLVVGMEMRRGRSGLSINAGFSANVLFQRSGVIIDPNTHEPARFGHIPEDPKAPGPKTPLSQDVFRTNLGLSATASIQWYWHLSPYFRVFVEPSFRQVLRPVTLENHPVEQRYSILGLRLGATTIF